MTWHILHIPPRSPRHDLAHPPHALGALLVLSHSTACGHQQPGGCWGFRKGWIHGWDPVSSRTFPFLLPVGRGTLAILGSPWLRLCWEPSRHRLLHPGDGRALLAPSRRVRGGKGHVAAPQVVLRLSVPTLPHSAPRYLLTAEVHQVLPIETDVAPLEDIVPVGMAEKLLGRG